MCAAVHRVTEVSDTGHLFGFLRCGGEADVGGAGEVVENLVLSRVLGCAASLAFVDHDQVEEVAGERLVGVHLFFSAADGLVERQVNLVRGVVLALLASRRAFIAWKHHELAQC